jgi:hypothetical protein
MAPLEPHVCAVLALPYPQMLDWDLSPQCCALIPTQIGSKTRIAGAAAASSSQEPHPVAESHPMEELAF